MENFQEQFMNDLDKPINDLDNPINDLDKLINDLDNPTNDLDKPSNDLDKPSTETNERPTLTDKEKDRVKLETGWSDEVVNSVGSMEEFEIYKKADLVEAKVGDKTCLVRGDIDMKEQDPMGRSNEARMEKGLAPLKDGKPIELHHIGQKNDSPLAELTGKEHRQDGNDTILHDKKKESEIDRNEFNKERAEHWSERGKMGDNLCIKS